jgi:hypothetical protein
MNGGEITRNVGTVCGGVANFGYIAYSSADGQILSYAETIFNGGSITDNAATATDIMQSTFRRFYNYQPGSRDIRQYCPEELRERDRAALI